MSDHGDMQGSHGRVNKALPYEESAGIPMIARAPGGRSGELNRTLVSGADLYPTLLDLAGITDNREVTGRSFARLIVRGGEEDRSLVSESPDRSWSMIRRGRWKLVADQHTGRPTMLFDLESDPYELSNLVSESSVAGVIRRLKAELFAWFH
jgi:arylsulfatase A-like enzyme